MVTLIVAPAFLYAANLREDLACRTPCLELAPAALDV
jgi:hypothetical protein